MSRLSELVPETNDGKSHSIKEINVKDFKNVVEQYCLLMSTPVSRTKC